MEEQHDRRKEPRKKLMAFTPVYDQHTGNMLGHIGDLTLQGALVLSEKNVGVNTQMTLAFELPGGLPGIKATSLEISARVARCEADESSQIYKIGFEFKELKPEQAKIIQALLERYRFRHVM